MTMNNPNHIWVVSMTQHIVHKLYVCEDEKLKSEIFMDEIGRIFEKNKLIIFWLELTIVSFILNRL